VASEDRLQRLLDRQDINDCLARMSRGIDRFDKAVFVSAFWEDAIVAAGPFVGSGEELFDWSSDFQGKAQTGHFHNTMNQTFDFDGDTAHVETYYFFVGMNRDDTNILAGGRYIDRFEKRGDEWRLFRRNNAIEWSSIVPAMANPLANFPGIDDNGLVTRTLDDISYLRPYDNKRARFVPPGM
jgi:hypothetical protein